MTTSITKEALSAVKKIIKHRTALCIAGKLLDVPDERLLNHDNSKLSDEEFSYYVEAFELGVKKDYHSQAWVHHWKNNDHHIEYWIDKDLTFTWSPNVEKGDILNLKSIGGGTKKVYNNGNSDTIWKSVWIPDDAIKEMIADWMAASYAYNDKWPKAGEWEWANNNLERVINLMEATDQPETSSRGLALYLLKKHNLITYSEFNKLNTLKNHF